MKLLSPEDIVSFINLSRVVDGAQVKSRIYFDSLFTPDPVTWRSVLQSVHFRRCALSNLDAANVAFRGRFVLEDCVIDAAQFTFTYFLGGLQILRCTFRSDLDFQSGGHNSGTAPCRIEDSSFEGFVNFADCWFEGPVQVGGCRFARGTNLLGNKRSPLEVRFDVPPIVAENLGALDLDGESAT